MPCYASRLNCFEFEGSAQARMFQNFSLAPVGKMEWSVLFLSGRAIPGAEGGHCFMPVKTLKEQKQLIALTCPTLDVLRNCTHFNGNERGRNAFLCKM